jgi:hypothetical protein
MGRLNIPSQPSELLPGVGGPHSTPPRQVHNPANHIRKARHRAAIRDLVDIMVLIAVDIFFLSWPAARIPYLTRDGSLVVLLFLHVVVVVSWLRTRWYSRWRAERIAGTWDDSERRRFAAKQRR